MLSAVPGHAPSLLRRNETMTENKRKHAEQVAAIQGLVRRLSGRIRTQRAVHGAVEGACLGLMIAAVGLAATRTGYMDPSMWWPWAALAFGLTAAGALLRAWPSIDVVAAAQKLDRAHGLHDRLSTAVSLATGESISPSDADFVEAQLRDALRFLDDVDPRQAAPFQTPADTRLLALLAVGVVIVGLIPIANHQKELPPPAFFQHDRVLDSATLALERDRLEQLRRQLERLPDHRAQEILDEIERLLNAVENREISEREFLEAIDALMERYFGDEARNEADTLATIEEALAEAARQIREEFAETLAEHPELEAVMEALEAGDQRAASEALQEFAENFKDSDLTSEQIERLADLLEAFADQLDKHSDALQDLYDQHREQFEALQEQMQSGDAPEGMEDLLRDAEQAMNQAREDLEAQQDSEAQRQLERLSAQLEEAAQDLRESQPTPGQADGEEGQGDPDGQRREGQDADGEDGPDGPRPPEEARDPDQPDYRNEVSRKMEDTARQLEEMEQEQERAQQREEIRRQLEEMRESMGRGDRQDEERDERRGEQMQDFMDRARGEQPDQPERHQAGDDEVGAGDDSSVGQEGESYEGEGEYDGESGSSGGRDTEQLAGDDEGLQEFDTVREEISGQDTGEGPSRSEVIRVASEGGFATTEYQDVYADYHEIAEEVMRREQVPDGYRYYIQRYFQLIRPQQ